MDEIWTAINEDLHSIVDKILEQPTETMGDLKLQLRAYALSESDLWIGGETEGAGDQARHIVEIVSRFVASATRSRRPTI